MKGQIRPAATVIVFRYGSQGLELLMLKRSRKAGFFPNAWVFPGGRLDAGDYDLLRTGSVKGLADEAFAVAAIRECFEESGVWLGQGQPKPGFRALLNAQKASLSDDPTLIPELNRLAFWAHWITPKGEARRYDTRFFLTFLSSDEQSLARHDDSETVDSRWITAEKAVALHESGEWFMAPPTYLILRELKHFDTQQQIEAHLSSLEVLPIQPVHRKDQGMLEILLPSHPDHPQRFPILESKRVWLDHHVWRLD